jgi:hypothetical protein
VSTRWHLLADGTFSDVAPNLGLAYSFKFSVIKLPFSVGIFSILSVKHFAFEVKSYRAHLPCFKMDHGLLGKSTGLLPMLKVK